MSSSAIHLILPTIASTPIGSTLLMNSITPHSLYSTKSPSSYPSLFLLFFSGWKTLSEDGVRVSLVAMVAVRGLTAPGWTPSTSEKTCLAESSLGSIRAGARYPVQTTKISAETLRDDGGLVASTLVKSWLKTQRREL